MSLLRPVQGRVVTTEWASRVVSPLHDVLGEQERRALLAGHPDSYLHVTSDPLVVPGAPGDLSSDAAKAAALRRLLDRGAYQCLTEPGYFVYRMRAGTEQHTGVVASVDLAGYADGSVLGHERVQEARVQALVRHYEHVPMRSELVTLFHRSDPVVSEAIAQVVREQPLLEFTDVTGIEQSVWRAGAEEAAALAARLDAHRHYVADGHHRLAAALRGWEQDGRPDGRSVLCALYSEDQVVLHAFHRRVRGPVGAEMLDAIGAAFDVRPATGSNATSGSIGMYAMNRWHLLVPHERSRVEGVAGVDVTMLDERILRPLLGIQADDPRLEFVPETRDLRPTTLACDEDGGMLFTLCAPSIDDLVSVAERGEVMSAKTTYVEPKPRTGIFLQ
jgi:uncharacterized protein (DUF1015 family)